MAVSVDRPSTPAGSTTTDSYTTGTNWTTDNGGVYVTDVNGGRLAEYPASQWIRVYQT